jgi:hypothetical protein
VTYNPAANHTGPDAFTFKVNDGSVDSLVATVSISVTAVNDAPTAVADSATTNEDTATAIDVLANDSDVDGDALSVTAITAPSHGTSVLITSGADAGKILYTPDANYNGTDSFTYKATDGTLTSAATTVSISVTAVNDAPVCVDDGASTAEDFALNDSVSCTDVDGDALSYIKQSDPSHGTLSFADDGTFTYTPDANFNGSDSFTFKANDGSADSDVAIYNITVSEVNDAPDAVDDSASLAEDGSVNLEHLLDNDSAGPDNEADQTLSITAVSDPAHGTATLEADGTVSYAPDADFNGSDSFTYAITDDGTTASAADPKTDTATVTLTVSEVNDAPGVVGGASQTANENDLVTVTASFADVDGNQTHTCSVSWGNGDAPTAGTVTENSDGTVGTCSATHRYLDDAPSATASDTYHASVTITDNGTTGGTADARSGVASVNVTIRNVAPVITSIVGPTAPIALGGTATVTANFTDVGTLDTHSCSFDWGDSSADSTSAGSAGACSSTHKYADSGVYTVSVTVTDDDTGAITGTLSTYTVIYNPNGGFVTGGGWINSPAGAYRPNPALVGRANYGFVSKYQKGATVPTGNTEFQFQVGNLNFHSETYEWLVISGSGASKAQYKGSGTINGVGNYGFMLTAIDGDNLNPKTVDRFRIKIWDRTTGNIVYDNQVSVDQSDTADPTTAIAGGNIVIHK